MPSISCEVKNSNMLDSLLHVIRRILTEESSIKLPGNSPTSLGKPVLSSSVICPFSSTGVCGCGSSNCHNKFNHNDKDMLESSGVSAHFSWLHNFARRA